MARLFRRFSSGAAIIGIAGLALLAICGGLGARFNLTPSLAVGLYWRVDASVTKGSYVMFCPPQTAVFAEAKNRGYIRTGHCPGNYAPLIKRVSGTAGDTVTITREGVSVNDALLPLSRPLSTDFSGKSMPHPAVKSFTLASSELLLMSDVNPKSFDSRYFGAVERAQVKDVIRPVFTW